MTRLIAPRRGNHPTKKTICPSRRPPGPLLHCYELLTAPELRRVVYGLT